MKPIPNYLRAILAIAVLAVVLSSCNELSEVSLQLAESTETSQVPTAIRTAVTVELPPDTGWLTSATGLENRAINLFSAEGALLEHIYITRIDPNFYRFEVGYRPADPLSLQGWLEHSGADLAINGGFFTEENEATGLVISNGETYGVSYQDYGGMLAIDEAGPSLRWLANEPYNPEEQLNGALQSFPMLIIPGEQTGYSDSGEEKARRSVIGRDRKGRFILLVAGIGLFTLNELSRFLIDSDLDLEIALNLDGGASSGLISSDVEGGVPSFSLLPTVILVYQK